MKAPPTEIQVGSLANAVSRAGPWGHVNKKQNGNPQETPLASMGVNSAPQHMRHNDPALCDSGILLWMRLTGDVPGTHIHTKGEGRLLDVDLPRTVCWSHTPPGRARPDERCWGSPLGFSFLHFLLWSPGLIFSGLDGKGLSSSAPKC